MTLIIGHVIRWQLDFEILFYFSLNQFDQNIGVILEILGFFICLYNLTALSSEPACMKYRNLVSSYEENHDMYCVKGPHFFATGAGAMSLEVKKYEF